MLSPLYEAFQRVLSPPSRTSSAGTAPGGSMPVTNGMNVVLPAMAGPFVPHGSETGSLMEATGWL